MKTQLFTSLLVCSSVWFCFSSCTKKEGTDPIPTTINSGLMAHYSFQGNANDISGHTHHATAYEAVLTTDRHGASNSAYLLDGVNDFLHIPTTTGLDNNNLTYSAWVKPMANPAANSYSCLMSVGNAGADQTMTINNNYHSTNGINVGGYNNPSTTLATSVDSKQLPALNQWVHVTYTRSNTEVRLYINGVQKGSISTNGASPKYNTPLLFTIGTRYNKSEGYFKGAMDEVKIYNRALSPTEVEELYNQ